MIKKNVRIVRCPHFGRNGIVRNIRVSVERDCTVYGPSVRTVNAMVIVVRRLLLRVGRLLLFHNRANLSVSRYISYTFATVANAWLHNLGRPL